MYQLNDPTASGSTYQRPAPGCRTIHQRKRGGFFLATSPPEYPRRRSQRSPEGTPAGPRGPRKDARRRPRRHAAPGARAARAERRAGVEVAHGVARGVETVIVNVERDFLDRPPVLPLGPGVDGELLLRAHRLPQGNKALVPLDEGALEEEQPRPAVARGPQSQLD